MNEIVVGGWVKIIKENKTDGLLGAVLKVINVSQETVDVKVLNQVVTFTKEEVMPISYKEVWGIEKLPTLYHGTDMRFASLPEEIRTHYLKICKLLIDALKKCQPLIDNKLKDEAFCEEIKEHDSKLLDNLKTAMGNLYAMEFSEEWEYGDFYLASSKHLAFMYACNAFAGGELGFTTYYLIRGAELIGINLADVKGLKDYIKAIKTLAESTPEPAIFSLDNLEIEHLQPAFGGSITNYIKDGRICINEFRYTAPVVLDMNKAEVFDPNPEKAEEIIDRLCDEEDLEQEKK